jgi:hypothetical protein
MRIDPLSGAAKAYFEGLSPTEINTWIDKAREETTIMPWQTNCAVDCGIVFCGECGRVGTTNDSDLCHRCFLRLREAEHE